MMKLDFQRAVLNRIPEIAKQSKKHFRQVFFICDEYQHFATVGENEPSGDEKFFASPASPSASLSSPPKASARSGRPCPAKPGGRCLQTFRTKIFLALSDDFSAKIASELCGQGRPVQGQLQHLRERARRRVSLLTGKAIAHKANVTTSKSYNTQSDFRFDLKTFTELKNAQSVTMAYDGLNPMPPSFCI